MSLRSDFEDLQAKEAKSPPTNPPGKPTIEGGDKPQERLESLRTRATWRHLEIPEDLRAKKATATQYIHQRNLESPWPWLLRKAVLSLKGAQGTQTYSEVLRRLRVIRVLRGPWRTQDTWRNSEVLGGLIVLRGTQRTQDTCRTYQGTHDKEFCVALILLKRRAQLSLGIPLW